MDAPIPDPESNEPAPSPRSEPKRPPLSQLAVVAIMCSAIFCCPLTSLVGFVTGAVAVRRIERSGGTLRGRGLAFAAMFLGTLGFIAWMLFASQLSERLRTDLERDLRETVTALFDEDPETRRAMLKARFDGGGRRAGADARALDLVVATATERYGALRSIETIGQPQVASTDGPMPESLAGLRFSFEDRSLIGEVRYRLVPSLDPESVFPRVLVLRIRIDDERLGALTLPAETDDGEAGSDGSDRRSGREADSGDRP